MGARLNGHKEAVKTTLRPYGQLDAAPAMVAGLTDVVGQSRSSSALPDHKWHLRGSVVVRIRSWLRANSRLEGAQPRGVDCEFHF